jgi:hypothetical protein
VSDVPTSVSLYVQPYYDGTLTPGVNVTSPAAVTISSISGTAGTVTVTTSANHLFQSGDTVTIAGTGAYDGIYPNIIKTSATTFTYSSSVTAAASGATPTVSAKRYTANLVWQYLKRDVYRILINRMLVSSSLVINPPAYASINLSMTVNINNAYKTSDVKAKIAKALLDIQTGIFSYGGFGFGATVSQSLIQAVIMSVPGVNFVNITLLSREGSSTSSDITLGPNEIPVLYPTNLLISTVGGI